MAIPNGLESPDSNVMRVWIPIVPGPELNPNTRVHWAKRARVARDARLATRLAVADMLRGLPAVLPQEGRLVLSWRILWGKSRRFLDPDNAMSSLKPYIDGCADALDRDDREFDIRIQQARMDRLGTDGVVLDILLVPDGDNCDLRESLSLSPFADSLGRASSGL